MNPQSQPQHSPSDQVLNGRFELRQTVLVDGFGEVKSAFDLKTGKEVSLRALRSPELALAIRQHLKLLNDFSHPNVVREYGVLSHGQGPALLVQGPLHGHHLGDFVAKHVQSGKPISLRGSYNVVAHVCNALGAIHARGTHGGVRPTAIWIGEDGKVQLSDLALARAALSTGGTAGLSPAEAAFLAPEVKAGQPPTPQSDIFSLGALLYVLLTGRSPMDAFVFPSQVHPEASPAVDAELIRALSPDPQVRHPSPDAFRSALLKFMEGSSQPSADDFGIDIEVEVNLASLAPGRPSGAPAAIVIPRAARTAGRDSGERPEVGARVSIHEPFRPSLEIDAAEADAARNRMSLGEIDLKDVLAKITEDDAPRWMVVKHGMDHGPFSGRQLVNMIVQGEALASHELMNTDTGKRGKLSEFAEFQEFLAQYELHRAEVERASALLHVETKEKHSTRFKLVFGVAAFGVIGLAAGIYALSRSGAGSSDKGDAELDMYRRGNVVIEGSAGILPTPRGGGGGARRSGSGGAGGAGGSSSYEEAMMQAIDIGSAHGAGEQQLTAATVAGVMNQHLNQLYRACVRGSVGSVKIDIAIAGSGQVMGVSVGAGDAGFQRCVAEQVRRIHFPGFSAPRMGARYSFGT